MSWAQIISVPLEWGMSGNFLSCIQGVEYRFEAQEGTWDFSRDAAVGKGLISRLGENPLVFLKAWRDVWGSYQVVPLVLPQGSQVSFRVVMGTTGFHASHCRGNRPHLDLCPETPCSSPVVTGISALHSRFTWGVKPCLELKLSTLLSSPVATNTPGAL